MTALLRSRSIAWLCAGAALAICLPVAAEKADRSKPMSLESDQPCTVNLLKQTSSCSGNVVVAQGTLLIRAERVELRETPEGYKLASAVGTDAKPAQYRQKRDNIDEHVEGTAQRIDYDSRANTLRFEGRAIARRLRGTVAADEIRGQVITWDNNAEIFNVQGGTATAANPGGRVTAVLAPRDAASAPPAPAASAAPTQPLRSTPALGERR
ncbi:lipopolysaccharide transport periplasmic protein LptA [Aquabacterium sp.]|uniref:lipopolysaccharide transport periplasmic protein LptA n=1 Tax=Aquabacterium sp. TaxID=1872578 RepID=UPI002CF1B23C|nr:lipopolysaccharide transport periplasmic protein LptA [Aquabacterium sp.]HSW05298.1 lipopolysaccharide transport periplasmic protein LptA [Aquabacterium sp.]